MKLEHLIVAKDSSVDTDKNTLSIFDIIEEITIKTEKSISSNIGIPLQLIAIFKRDKEVGVINGNAEVQALDPNNKICLKEKVVFRVEPQHKRTRLRINLVLPISGPGMYKMIVEGMSSKVETDIVVNIEKTLAPKEAHT